MTYSLARPEPDSKSGQLVGCESRTLFQIRPMPSQRPDGNREGGRSSSNGNVQPSEQTSFYKFHRSLSITKQVTEETHYDK